MHRSLALITAALLTVATGLAHGADATADDGAPPKNIVLIGDSNTWYYDRPVAAHKVMEHMLTGITFTNKTWKDARVHNLAISGTRPYDWIVEKTCVEGSKGDRYPINAHCDEIEFLAEGITKVVPSPDVVIVNLGTNSYGKATAAEAADHLVKLKKYLETISPKVIMAGPLPTPRGNPRAAFSEEVRWEMEDRGILDWEFPLMEFEGKNRKIHVTERARARHGALMAIWLVYGAPDYTVGGK